MSLVESKDIPKKIEKDFDDYFNKETKAELGKYEFV